MSSLQQELERVPVAILHGNHEQGIHDYLATLLAYIDEHSSENILLDKVDGNSITIDGLTNDLRTIPFFSSTRYVIIEDPFPRLKSKNDQERFISLISALPDKIRTVLIIPDYLDKGKWVKYGEKSWLKKWADKKDSKAIAKLFSKPKQKDMGNWIQKHTQSLDGQISSYAAHVLAEFVGDDTRFAHQEILKLLTYVDYKRQIETDDVHEVSIPGGQQDVFKMVDALAMGNASKALDHLHGLLEKDEPGRLFAMIVRQFRYLVQIKEFMGMGYQDKEAANKVSLHPYAVKQMYIQAKRFSQKQLEDIFHKLLDIDIGIKTGEIEPVLAMDLFVAEMSN